MPGNYLESNLRLLSNRDAALAEKLRSAYRPDYPEIRYTREGLPVPVIDNKCLHSTYNPQTEASKWLESLQVNPAEDRSYILCGMGFWLSPE